MNETLRQSYRFCGAIARRQARNFYYAFMLLPSEERWAMCALYAYLRHTDDLADEPGSAADKFHALDCWRKQLDLALGGTPVPWPGLYALADTVSRYGIRPELLHQVIDGVLMDVRPAPFANFDDLAVYCHRVASVVGLCCLSIWGYRSEHGMAEALAEKCGIALQLTNIIRDVGEDARDGRIYLPMDELERFKVSSDELAATRIADDRVRDLLAFQARRAYLFYDEAAALLPLVSPVGRPVLATITGIYRALLDEIVARDYNVFAARAKIPARRKVGIMIKSLCGRFIAAGPGPVPTAGSSASATPLSAPSRLP
jgi:phytoene synthase